MRAGSSMAGDRHSFHSAIAYLGLCVWLVAISTATTSRVLAAPGAKSPHDHVPMFATSQDCIACHNSLTPPPDEDVSVGVAWRSSIVANSSRDPYWQASVRRETIDHPMRATDIEDECSICH